MHEEYTLTGVTQVNFTATGTVPSTGKLSLMLVKAQITLCFFEKLKQAHCSKILTCKLSHIKIKLSVTDKNVIKFACVHVQDVHMLSLSA